MDLLDKVALVTGGAQGIGKAICEILLKNGCKVSCADVNVEKGEETVKEFQHTYGEKKAIFVKCDVSSKSEFKDAYEKTKEVFGGLNILVNNAGVLGERAVDVNLKGTMTGCKLALEFMGKHNGGYGGTVVNTASIAGLRPGAFLPEYSASKAGVIALTRAYGNPLTYNLTGIVFCSVCPTFVDTELTRTSPPEIHSKEFNIAKKEFDIAEPSDIAEAILRLINDQQSGGIMEAFSRKKNRYVDFPEM